MSLALSVVLVVLLAAVAGFLAGVSYTVRVWKARQPEAGARPKSVPFPGTACEECRRNFPDWFCFLGGCP